MKKSLSHHLRTGIPRTSAAKSEDLAGNPCIRLISEVGCATNIAVGPGKGFDVVSRAQAEEQTATSPQWSRNGDQERAIGDLGIVGPGYYPLFARKERSCNKLGSFVVDNISTADIADLLKNAALNKVRGFWDQQDTHQVSLSDNIALIIPYHELTKAFPKGLSCVSSAPAGSQLTEVHRSKRPGRVLICGSLHHEKASAMAL